MTEISFARSFLSALDARPVKISSDHVADARQLPSGAVYVIPKYPNAPKKRKRDAAPATAPSTKDGYAVTLKNMKTAEHSLSLTNTGAGTSVFDLKTAYAEKWNVSVEKIKLLYEKKPIADSKTLKEVAEPGKVECTIMLLAGAVPSEKKAEAPKDTEMGGVSAGPSGKELETEAFWTDLKGFLVQRLKDEKEGARLAKVFRKAAG